MGLIDAEALGYEVLEKYGADGGSNDVNVIYSMIINAPTVDIVRCRDCRHWDANDSMGEFCWCDFSEDRRAPDDFCSYGERKERL